MVHTRLNEKEPNPNPHINFITPLRLGDTAAEEDARQLLRALAAHDRHPVSVYGLCGMILLHSEASYAREPDAE